MKTKARRNVEENLANQLTVIIKRLDKSKCLEWMIQSVTEREITTKFVGFANPRFEHYTITPTEIRIDGTRLSEFADEALYCRIVNEGLVRFIGELKKELTEENQENLPEELSQITEFRTVRNGYRIIGCSNPEITYAVKKDAQKIIDPKIDSSNVFRSAFTDEINRIFEWLKDTSGVSESNALMKRLMKEEKEGSYKQNPVYPSVVFCAGMQQMIKIIRREIAQLENGSFDPISDVLDKTEALILKKNEQMYSTDKIQE